MAPTYKLTYFPVTALGEPIRWLLAVNKIQFEDYRFKGENFATDIKPSTPFGKVPMLEVDGKKLTQSGAICRWLARKGKLTGKDDDDALAADIIVDTISDFREALASYHYDQNPATKAPKLEPLQKTTVPFYLSRLDKIVKDNNGYFVNGQLTWADIYFVAILDYLQTMSAGLDFLKDNPNLAQLKKKVLDIPEIKAFVAQRLPDGQAS